jgi:hypothetical protein
MGHPGCESFVQPDVIPPLHSDQIAKPHVRHFVREDGNDGLVRVDGGVLVVDGEKSFAVRDGGGIFHGARGKIGEGDDVQLLEGIFYLVIVVIKFQDIFGGEERVGEKILFFRHSANADRDAVSAALDAGEVADHHGD